MNIWVDVIDQAMIDVRKPTSLGEHVNLREVREEALGYLFSELSDDAFMMCGIVPDAARKQLAVKFQNEIGEIHEQIFQERNDLQRPRVLAQSAG